MGGIAGVPGPTVAKKVWTSFEAVGDLAFAYPYSLILLEIQVQLVIGLTKLKDFRVRAEL